MEHSLCLEVCGCLASEEILILSLLYSQRLYHKTTSWATWIHSKPTHYVTYRSANTVWLPSFPSGTLIVKNHTNTKHETWLSYKLWCTDSYWLQWRHLIVNLLIIGCSVGRGTVYTQKQLFSVGQTKTFNSSLLSQLIYRLL